MKVGRCQFMVKSRVPIRRLIRVVKMMRRDLLERVFNLALREICYFSIYRGIHAIPLLSSVDFVRTDTDEILKRELDWVNPRAHYFDNLSQALMAFVMRTKFKIDRRLFNYSALVRSGQMPREEVLQRVTEVYSIEDPKFIDLCIKRLGLTRKQFDEILESPVKTFRDYPSSYPSSKSSVLLFTLLPS